MKQAESFWQWVSHDAISYFTFWLAIFTGLLVAVGGIQLILFWRQLRFLRQSINDAGKAANAASDAAQAAYEANRLSREQFLTDKRPWITVKARLIDHVKWEEKGVRFHILCTFKNIGAMPATQLFAEVIGTANSGKESLVQYCEDIKRGRMHPNADGPILLPNQKKPMLFSILISRDDIMRNIVKCETENMYIPHVIGCVSYSFSASSEVHQTGFSYYVVRSLPGNNPGARMLPVNKDLSIFDIGLTESPYGGIIT